MHVHVVAAGQHRENFLLVKNATSYLLCSRSFMESLPSSTGTRQGVLHRCGTASKGARIGVWGLKIPSYSSGV